MHLGLNGSQMSISTTDGAMTREQKTMDKGKRRALYVQGKAAFSGVWNITQQSHMAKRHVLRVGQSIADRLPHS